MLPGPLGPPEEAILGTFFGFAALPLLLLFMLSFFSTRRAKEKIHRKGQKNEQHVT